MLKLEDLLKLQQLKFYFKFNEGSLPVYLQNLDITPNAHVHNYNTRELGCMHIFCESNLLVANKLASYLILSSYIQS